MDNNNQPSAETELASTLKKSKSEFFKDWLKRKRLPLIPRPRSREVQAEGQTKESRLNRILSSIRERLPRRFNRSFGVEVKPVSPESVERAEKSTTETAKPTADNLSQPESKSSNISRTIFEQSVPNQETSGLLPLSDEAVQRYQFAQASSENLDTGQDQSELNLPFVTEAPDPEPIRIREKTRVVNESVDHPILPTNVLALSAGEILRRQRERHLRQEVRHLKKEANSANQERNAVIKQQQEFQGQLDEQSKRANQVEQGRLPKLERAYDTLPQQNKPELTTVRIEAQPPVKVEAVAAKPDLRPDKLKEIVSLPPSRPEQVRQTVEKAAERNMPIERLYEQRHERKDEQAAIAAAQAATKTNKLTLDRLRSGFSQLPPPMMSMPAIRKSTEPVKAPAASTEPQAMYKQAAMSGFWAAIVLCAILVILLLSR